MRKPFGVPPTRTACMRLTHVDRGLYLKCLALLHLMSPAWRWSIACNGKECRRHIREFNDCSLRRTHPARVREGGQARLFSCAAASTRSGVSNPSVNQP